MSLIHVSSRVFVSYLEPKLTYLPPKYHQYVIPGVRRVYLDTSGEAALQKKLTRAENTVRKLEAEQETLLKQCEKHMSASRAHADGEMKERQRANRLQRNIDALSAQVIAENEASEACIKEIKADREQLKSEYQKLKKYHRDLEEKSVQCYIFGHLDLIPVVKDRRVMSLNLKSNTRSRSPIQTMTPLKFLNLRRAEGVEARGRYTQSNTRSRSATLTLLNPRRESGVESCLFRERGYTPLCRHLRVNLPLMRNPQRDHDSLLHLEFRLVALHDADGYVLFSLAFISFVFYFR